jgi:hypothetical protein
MQELAAFGKVVKHAPTVRHGNMPAAASSKLRYQSGQVHKASTKQHRHSWN